MKKAIVLARLVMRMISKEIVVEKGRGALTIQTDAVDKVLKPGIVAQRIKEGMHFEDLKARGYRFVTVAEYMNLVASQGR